MSISTFLVDQSNFSILDYMELSEQLSEHNIYFYFEIDNILYPRILHKNDMHNYLKYKNSNYLKLKIDDPKLTKELVTLISIIFVNKLKLVKNRISNASHI